MSDTASRRSSGEQASQRRKGPPRGGRRAAEIARRNAAAAEVAEVAVPTQVEVAAPSRSRRSSLRSTVRPVALSREAELAYIRADLRRLYIIAGCLLVLMLVILVIVER
ncbi:MAG: hypothetical protein IT338_13430 [Thermomicrobiales bacterium]|nr:hypothetical protein [Thermomicrobiales bacterium]